MDDWADVSLDISRHGNPSDDADLESFAATLSNWRRWASEFGVPPGIDSGVDF